MDYTLIIGDLHVGSTVAIWPEHGLLPEGGEWSPNKPQRHLLKKWRQMEEELPDRLRTIIVNGDVIEGAKPRNVGLVTQRLDYQASAAIDLLSPLRDRCDNFYMIRGTEFHGGDADQNVTQIARSLSATPNPMTREWTWPELLYDMGDDNIWHIAHHMGTSKNPAYEATALLSSFTTFKLNLDLAYGRRAPHLTGMARSHAHRLFKIEKPPWYMIAVTGWKLKDDYAYRVAPSSLPEIGYGLISYDGDIHVRARKFDIPLMHVEGR